MRVWRSNWWNRFIYGLWAPVYDVLVGVWPLARARREAFELLMQEPGQRVLLVGVGTGADFELLADGVVAVGVDLSEAMLGRARRKLAGEGREIRLEVADAMDLPFEDGSFEVVVLTLILSVVEDGRVALKEAVRVVGHGGRVLIFDKFLPDGTRPSAGRRLLNGLTSVFGTDINRRFEDLVEGLPVRMVRNEGSLFSGSYRAILLEVRKD